MRRPRDGHGEPKGSGHEKENNRPAQTCTEEIARAVQRRGRKVVFAARSVLCRVQYPRRLLHRPEARTHVSPAEGSPRKTTRIRPGAAAHCPGGPVLGGGS